MGTQSNSVVPHQDLILRSLAKSNQVLNCTNVPQRLDWVKKWLAWSNFSSPKRCTVRWGIVRPIQPNICTHSEHRPGAEKAQLFAPALGLTCFSYPFPHHWAIFSPPSEPSPHLQTDNSPQRPASPLNPPNPPNSPGAGLTSVYQCWEPD